MLSGVFSSLSERLDSIRQERWMFCYSLNSWSREFSFEVDVNGAHTSQRHLHATFSSFSVFSCGLKTFSSCLVYKKKLRHRHVRHVHDLARHPGDAQDNNKATPPTKHEGRKGGKDEEESQEE